MSELALPIVHVLYENPSWLPPLLEALEDEDFEYCLHHVNQFRIDGYREPPDGIWLNRISPSSHTRGHTETVAIARELLHWLEHHGRRVVNGSNALGLEMSKLRQDLALRKHGIRTPRTLLTVGDEQMVKAASVFDGPFLTKHNRGGKGLGIELFDSPDQLRERLQRGGFDHGPNRQVILQQYIEPRDGFITRVELVGGRFLYAMRSSTAEGFELCPSDACQVPSADGAAGASKFSPSPLQDDDPLVRSYLELCAAEGIEIAGIEFVEGVDGKRYTYDINGTTNYSGTFGKQIGIDGMREVARYLKSTVEAAWLTAYEAAQTELQLSV